MLALSTVALGVPTGPYPLPAAMPLPVLSLPISASGVESESVVGVDTPPVVVSAEESAVISA
jgi:hypothetical protein